MRRWEASLSSRHFSVGSGADEPTVRRNFCFGRKAEVRPCNTKVGLRLNHTISRFGNDFRFASNNRHENSDVAFRRIYFRCWSGSEHGAWRNPLFFIGSRVGYQMK